MITIPRGEDGTTYSDLVPSGLRRRLDKSTILQSAVRDFQPVDDIGNTLRTSPLDAEKTAAYRYLQAAIIMTSNPLCFIATKALQDEVTSAKLIVEEKQGNTWVKHEGSELEDLIEEPTEYSDKLDFLRAYVAQLPNFGKVQILVLGQGDTLPDGRINNKPIAMDIPMPTRLVKDFRVPTQERYLYQPLFATKSVSVEGDRVITDKSFNPVNPYEGISVTGDVLDGIFNIDRQYRKMVSDFFDDGGMPRGLLIKRIDVTKDPNEMAITPDTEVTAQIQKLYNQVNQRGRRRNLAGIKGDWDYKQLTAGLTDLLNKDLTHHLEVLVSGVYGVPASLFWVGLQLSNQRASRQMDAIGFYSRTIYNLMQGIETKLTRKLLKTIQIYTGVNLKKFRLRFDTSEMPLAQFTRLSDNREKERWWQEQIIPRGYLYDFLNLDKSRLTGEQLEEMYQGSKGAGADLNIGKGSQSIEEGNGLE